MLILMGSKDRDDSAGGTITSIIKGHIYKLSRQISGSDGLCDRQLVCWQLRVSVLSNKLLDMPVSLIIWGALRIIKTIRSSHHHYKYKTQLIPGGKIVR
jgi:hypothetical protein